MAVRCFRLSLLMALCGLTNGPLFSSHIHSNSLKITCKFGSEVVCNNPLIKCLPLYVKSTFKALAWKIILYLFSLRYWEISDPISACISWFCGYKVKRSVNNLVDNTASLLMVNFIIVSATLMWSLTIWLSNNLLSMWKFKIFSGCKLFNNDPTQWCLSILGCLCWKNIPSFKLLLHIVQFSIVK